MKLNIEISGQMERIVISSMPKKYITKIFKHCMGKNNTPYFVNNCLKGVLYFDVELAKKFAETEGYDWKEWYKENRFYQSSGYSFEMYLDIAANYDGGDVPLSAMDLETKVESVGLDGLLPKVPDDEVIIVMGSVDKGTAMFTLKKFSGDFDQDKIIVHLDSFENFRMQDKLITGISYDGVAMEFDEIRATGKNMVSPVLISNTGEELEMLDFLGFDGEF